MNHFSKDLALVDEGLPIVIYSSAQVRTSTAEFRREGTEKSHRVLFSDLSQFRRDSCGGRDDRHLASSARFSRSRTPLRLAIILP